MSEPDLELASTEALWQELAARYSCAMLLTTQPDKVDPDEEVVYARVEGSRITAMGMLSYGKAYLESDIPGERVDLDEE